MSQRRDWYYWRIFATGLSFSLFGVGGLVLGLLVLPCVALITPNRLERTRRCRLLVHYSFRAFIGIMRGLGVLTYDISGRQNMSQQRLLVVANHPTLIDIVFLISIVPDACCIVKAALYRNPITRRPVSWAGYISNDSPEELIDDCAAELEQGTTLVVFPEGTRSVPGKGLRFKRGAAYVWLRTRCNLVLATIGSNPPTLAKYEKWYQVPYSRPHFSLEIRRMEETSIALSMAEAELDPRTLNRLWQTYFEREITT
jgi:1-acyl-sn-glycerol-3-phosphate acyltransferase